MHFAIGDVQGCVKSLCALLRKIPEHAQLWFCGDLINRGPASLATLDLILSLGDRAQITLGNHDLHFLATAAGTRKQSKSDTLTEILCSKNLPSYVDWMRKQALAKAFSVGGQQFLVLHAGVLPHWTYQQTLSLSNEVSACLGGSSWRELVSKMYSDKPDKWSDDIAVLQGKAAIARHRLVINALTRARLVFEDGSLDLVTKEGLGQYPKGTIPWFEHPSRQTQGVTIVFGHWSTLGLMVRPNAICIDTGCVWGGKLSAMNLETRELIQVDYAD